MDDHHFGYKKKFLKKTTGTSMAYYNIFNMHNMDMKTRMLINFRFIQMSKKRMS